MRLPQSAQIDGRQRLLRDHVHPGDGISAVIRNVRGLSIVRYGRLMRIVSDGHARHDGEARRIDDHQGVLLLLEHQQSVCRRAGRFQGGGESQERQTNNGPAHEPGISPFP